MKSKADIRAEFRDAVFARDRYQCVMCGISQREVEARGEHMDAHHIIDRNDMPHGGYVAENGISLCPECHIKAEKYHQTDGWDWEEGFHPNSLYYRIGSSPQLAVEVSERKLG